MACCTCLQHTRPGLFLLGLGHPASQHDHPVALHMGAGKAVRDAHMTRDAGLRHAPGITHNTGATTTNQLAARGSHQWLGMCPARTPLCNWQKVVAVYEAPLHDVCPHQPVQRHQLGRQMNDNEVLNTKEGLSKAKERVSFRQACTHESLLLHLSCAPAVQAPVATEYIQTSRRRAAPYHTRCTATLSMYCAAWYCTALAARSQPPEMRQLQNC
jgi:hypothetical protein